MYAHNDRDPTPWRGWPPGGRRIPLLMDAPDIMPTLLGLCELPIPATVQGRDLSAAILGKEDVDPEMSCLLKVPVPCKRMPHACRWTLAPG